MKQISSFTGNLDQAGNVSNFCKRTVRVLSISFALREYKHKDDSIEQYEYKITYFLT